MKQNSIIVNLEETVNKRFRAENFKSFHCKAQNAKKMARINVSQPLLNF